MVRQAADVAPMGLGRQRRMQAWAHQQQRLEMLYGRQQQPEVDPQQQPELQGQVQRQAWQQQQRVQQQLQQHEMLQQWA